MKNVYSSSVYLRYDLDSAFPMTRRYPVDYEFYKASPEFKQIYESKEFKDFFTPGNLNYAGLVNIYINTDMPNKEPVEIHSKADMMEFMACLDQDFKAQSFADMVSLKRAYATANINFTYKDETSTAPDKLVNNSVVYRITDSYKNSIRWLEAHGYGSRFVRSTDDIEYIELFHYVQQENVPNQAQPAQFGPNQVTSAVQLDGLKVDDPAKIQQLLDTYESQNINYNDYYYGTIVYKGGGEPVDPAQIYKDNYGYNPEMAEKYGVSATSGVTNADLLQRG